MKRAAHQGQEHAGANLVRPSRWLVVAEGAPSSATAPPSSANAPTPFGRQPSFRASVPISPFPCPRRVRSPYSAFTSSSASETLVWEDFQRQFCGDTEKKEKDTRSTQSAHVQKQAKRRASAPNVPTRSSGSAIVLREMGFFFLP